ncbi:MAG: sugar porter family MFS transporter [Pirellulales bacterium]
MIPTDLRNNGICGPRSGLYLGGICLTASLAGLLFGFDTAVISGTFEFVEEQFHLTKLQVGWFGSSALLGCILGAAVAGMLGDRFGRKPILIISAVFFFISALFSAIPPSFAVLIWARIVGGVGVGMASVLTPMYISEFAPPNLRGRLVATYQLSIVIGILAAYCCNWLLLAVSERYPEMLAGQRLLHWTIVSEVWRGMFGAEMIPAGLFFFLMLLVPESPRWLAKESRDAEALKILAGVSGHEVARRQLAEIQESLTHEVGSIAELFRPGLRKALAVGVGLAFFGQLTGVNVVIYYGPAILRQAGFERIGAFQFQVGFGLINLIFTLIALGLIDRIGRRPLLLGGMTIVTLSLTATGALFLWGTAHALSESQADAAGAVLSQDIGRWVVGILGLYMACIAISICAVIWVITAEIFPNRLRGRAVSIATLTNWLANSASTFLFPSYVQEYGMHTGFLTFAAICFVGTIFFWRYVPETKGKSLEEIERSWLAGTSATHSWNQ